MNQTRREVAINVGAPFEPLSISLTPLNDQMVRRATRVLNMVHELHKVGYQRLRIVPGMAPSGSYWRCLIVPDGHVRDNGWEPKGEDWRATHQRDLAATYSTGDGAEFFGWTDAASDSARQLAVKLVERFPDLTWAGRGLDPAYAGWLTWMLGNAESGRLPVFYADHPVEVDEGSMPPPPIEPTFGSRQTLKNEELRAENIPDVERWQEFALTFDERGWDGYNEFFRMAEQRLTDTLTHLRARLFIKQRWFKVNDHLEPTERDYREIADLLGQIRQRVQIAQELLT